MAYIIFIQGPGAEAKFLALRKTKVEAANALRYWVKENPRRRSNAFIIHGDYFNVEGGKAKHIV